VIKFNRFSSINENTPVMPHRVFVFRTTNKITRMNTSFLPVLGGGQGVAAGPRVGLRDLLTEYDGQKVAFEGGNETRGVRGGVQPIETRLLPWARPMR
jgi:hypothetical protein